MIQGFDLFYPAKIVYNNIANNYRKKNCDKNRTRTLMVGEIHPLCANFEGPGTRIDLPEVRNFPPYNGVDACAKDHDIAYYDINKETSTRKKEKMIREADRLFLECVEKHKDEGLYYKLAHGIQLKNNIEDSIVGKYIIPKDYYGSK